MPDITNHPADTCGCGRPMCSTHNECSGLCPCTMLASVPESINPRVTWVSTVATEDEPEPEDVVVCSRCDRRTSEVCNACDLGSCCCECYYCEHCSEVHDPWDEPRCREGNDHCRESCECRSEVIYSHRTNVLDYCDFQGCPKGGIYLGVELEVEIAPDFSSRHREAKKWNKEAGHWTILKEDGSLNCGFEIVTAPSDLRVHRQNWLRLLKDSALTGNLRGWTTSSAGMHVHASRKPLSDLTIGKMLTLINNPDNAQQIKRQAGRNSESYAQLIPDKQLRDGFLPADGRYQALNLLNEKTVEFRIFRSSLDPRRVIANVEFCAAVCHWALQVSLKHAKYWSSFMEYVTKNRKEYPYLVQFWNNSPRMRKEW